MHRAYRRHEIPSWTARDLLGNEPEGSAMFATLIAGVTVALIMLLAVSGFWASARKGNR